MLILLPHMDTVYYDARGPSFVLNSAILLRAIDLSLPKVKLWCHLGCPMDRVWALSQLRF